MKSFARQAKKYLVEIDPAMVQRKFQQVPFDVNILCDAQVFTRRLLALLDRRSRPLPDYSGWTERVMEWKHQYDPVRRSFLPNANGCIPTRSCGAFRKNGRDGYSGRGLRGQHRRQQPRVRNKFGQRNLTNNGNSPMGFSFAGAMGAWFADPARQVVCTIGDGGFNMNPQELQTFVNYGVKVKTFILNNHIYGITKAYQETNFQGRAEACGPKGYHPPDFFKLVEAYGIKTVAIGKHAEMDTKIDEVLQFDGPVVCDVDMHEFHTYEPRIFGWKTPVEDSIPICRVKSSGPTWLSNRQRDG